MTNGLIQYFFIVSLFMLFVGLVVFFCGFGFSDFSSDTVYKKIAVKSIMYICYVVGAVLALLGLFTLIRCIYFSEFFPSLFDRFKVFWNII